MRMLPEPIPPEESRALARRLIEPLWAVLVLKGDDTAKYRTLEILVEVDPAGALEKLEAAKSANTSLRSRIQAVIAAAMAVDDPKDAAAVAEAIEDAGARAGALIDVADALTEARRPPKLDLLDRAVLHARAAVGPDARLRWLGHSAVRLHKMGEVEKVRALFRRPARRRRLPGTGPRPVMAGDLARGGDPPRRHEAGPLKPERGIAVKTNGVPGHPPLDARGAASAIGDGRKFDGDESAPAIALDRPRFGKRGPSILDGVRS